MSIWSISVPIPPKVELALGRVIEILKEDGRPWKVGEISTGVEPRDRAKEIFLAVDYGAVEVRVLALMLQEARALSASGTVALVPCSDAVSSEPDLLLFTQAVEVGRAVFESKGDRIRATRPFWKNIRPGRRGNHCW